MTKQYIAIKGISLTKNIGDICKMKNLDIMKPRFYIDGQKNIIGMKIPVKGLRFKPGPMDDDRALACSRRLRALGCEVGAYAIEIGVICEEGTVTFEVS